MVKNAGNSRKQQRGSLLQSVESFTGRQTLTSEPTVNDTVKEMVSSVKGRVPSTPKRSERDIVLLSGHVYRTFNTRVTPEHLQALRVAAVEHDTTIQAVVNALVEEGLMQGKCALDNVENYRERRR